MEKKIRLFHVSFNIMEPLHKVFIQRVLNSKKVTDHHAIIPTIEITKADLAALPETERKILSLVAGRLLCATG